MTALRSENCEQHKAHGANWSKWLAPFSGTKHQGIELGAWLAESTEWFMEHVVTHPEAKLFTVDHFQGSAEHSLAGINCEPNERTARERLARFEDRVAICKGDTAQVLRTLQRHSLSWAYIDADHSAMGTLRDSVLVFDAIVPGGVIIWDDYQWEVMEAPVDRPKMGIDAFLACYARRIEVLSFGGWQVAVRKVA